MPIYVTIPEEIEADKLVNDFIKEYCGNLVGHLLDSDENGGSKLRTDINNLIISAYHRGMNSTDR